MLWKSSVILGIAVPMIVSGSLAFHRGLDIQAKIAYLIQCDEKDRDDGGTGENDQS